MISFACKDVDNPYHSNFLLFLEVIDEISNSVKR